MKKLLLLALLAAFAFVADAQKYRGKKMISREEQLNERYARGLFKSQYGTIIDLTGGRNVSAAAYYNILQWLQGRVAGLQVYRNQWGTTVPFIRGQRAMVYVDEMPVDISYFDLLPVQDIAIIKIFKSTFLGGFGGGGSAIAIYTLRGYEDE